MDPFLNTFLYTLPPSPNGRADQQPHFQQISFPPGQPSLNAFASGSAPPPAFANSSVLSTHPTSEQPRQRRSSAPGRYRSIPTIPVLPSIPESSDLYRPTNYAPQISNLPPIPPPIPFSHSQQRLRAPRQPKPDPYLQMESLLPLITQRFRTLGRFLEILFTDFPRRSGPDRRTSLHRNLVSGFLRGKNRMKAVDTSGNGLWARGSLSWWISQ
ncbi:hypothetical protein BDZ89DRAFT_1146363 [Hymenopellis radicata]|nr:hypothetical protein BDZ89DRAFT_1146363 [Hymenopellis radicata]